MRYISKRALGLLLAIVFMGSLTACGQKVQILDSSDEIITLKPLTEGKINVTVLVKYAFTINTFEKAVEKRFPKLNLIQVGNYTNSSSNELEQRMANDDLTDLIFEWPLNAGQQYFEDCLLDLSGMPFTSKYNISMLDKLSQDGKLYYIPGPAQIRGLVYNKTMFEEQGWEVPEAFEGFLSLCREIEAAGIRPLQLSLKEPEVIETAFWGFGYNNTLSRPQQAQMLADFNDQEDSFGSFTQSAFESFQRLVDEGILKQEDLDVQFYERTDSLFSRQCAMISDGARLTRIGMEWSDCKDEFAVMPFFSPGESGDWAQLYLTSYIGLNKNLSEPENKEKYDLVMQLMEFISTEEGQKDLAGDDGGMISSVVDVPLPNIPEIEDMRPALEHSRYSLFPTLDNAQGALHDGLSGLLAGQLNAEDVIEMVDAQNANPPPEIVSAEIGLAEKTFSTMETGNFVTDAMRAYSDADFALFLDNGKDGEFNARGISAKIYKGNITEDDIRLRVLPVLQHSEKGVLQTVTICGADLSGALEYTLDKGGWFYYFSGLRMEFIPSAEPGNRIRNLTDENQKQIEPEKLYTVAIMDGSVDDKYIRSTQDTKVQIYDIVCDAIRRAETISPAEDGRFMVSTP